MKQGLHKNKDFWAGAMFIGIGAAALFVAQGYRFGSTYRMGPGFFPSVLSGLLILFGLYIMGKGLRSGEKIKTILSVRALLALCLSVLLFGILMQHAGFIPALIALIFGAAVAGREFKFFEVLLLAMVLTGFSVAIFIWGLGLP
ncbi:MAG: tripartite tricarboxylate transporter TctB family protein, partial [Deltaproteobacteria bacterium]